MISQECREMITQLANRYPRKESALLPALDAAQREANGCIEKDDLAAIAAILGLTAAEVFGVWSFYTMYNRKPVGKFHLQVDANVPAMLMGADDIVAHLEKSLGISVGQTTSDGLFTLTTVQDLGSCGTCPVIQVNDRYYENMTIEKTDELIASLRKGQMPDWKAKANWGTECN
ncbi:MAG: NAD(P)H-dependent oxidoreductase subunit E, partial [Sedimentisphaerales bacterium]|nr:NAD(P)H-dependent oxidoreductase subunit E [Sedimentisphaerales bacterium]